MLWAGRWLGPIGLEGIEAIVFRTIGDQVPLWESILPPKVLRLPEELACSRRFPSAPVMALRRTSMAFWPCDPVFLGPEGPLGGRPRLPGRRRKPSGSIDEADLKPPRA